MKKMKKLLSMVLVLSMVLSLNMTVFAATDAATLNITVDGTDYVSEATDSGINVKEALEAVTTLDLELEFTGPFTDYYGNEAYVLKSMMGAGSMPADGPSSGETVTAWSSSNPGYGLVSTDVDAAGTITYTYIYIGYDWTYTVTDATGADVDVSSLYINQYTIQDGDTVTVDYAYQRVVWSTTTPVLTSYPYI